jgi:hypothetical protein
LTVTISGKSAKESIITTKEHPFFVVGRGFLPAGMLKRGDVVLRARGTSTTIGEIKQSNTPQLAYNLAVAHDHTYFVGKNKILVHNSCLNLDLVLGAAKRLGVNLDKITRLGDVAHLRIGLTNNISINDINLLKDLFRSQGLKSVKVETGYIANDQLDAFLSRRLKDGKFFMGGKVLPGNSNKTDYIIEFKL